MKKKFTSQRAYVPGESVSQVTIKGNMAFISGQISFDPVTGQYIHDDMASQTRRILTNIQALLEDLGLTLDDVMACNISIASMADFEVMDEVYTSFFGTQCPPARKTVVAGIWDNLRIEIAAIAIADHAINA